MFYRLILRLLDWVIPERLLSRLVGIIARRNWPAFILQPFLRWYCRKFDVNMDEAKYPLNHYKNFIEFFTRPLKEDVRTIDEAEDMIISPVDGTIYSFGRIDKDTIIQAKGVFYTIVELLDDEEKATQYEDGAFIIIYLSPRDYHRIHAPLDGQVEGFRYIPGKLLPVNPPSVAMFPKLFVENERLATYLDTEGAGQVAVVKVGATIVGRICLEYVDYYTNRWITPRSEHRHLEKAISLEKGAEMARFELGSTVILLFPEGVELSPDLEKEKPIYLGETIARMNLEN